MCCILSILLLIGPRAAFIFTWLFQSERVTNAFSGNLLLPLLGVIFLPFTSLFYVLVAQPGGGLQGFFPWALVIVGLIIDLSSYGGGLWGNRNRFRNA